MAATDETSAAPAADTGASRARSPNYPALPFTEALERAKTIYEKDHRSPLSPDVAAQHMGYSKMNGSSFPIMGSLKRYGLVVPAGKDGKDIRISDDAHYIFAHEDGSPERLERMAKLAMSPSLFADILAKYPPPWSDANLVAKLQVEWKFLKPAAVSIVKALKDAVRLRDEALAGGAPAADTGAEPTKEATVNNQPTPPIKTPMSPKAPLPTTPYPPYGVAQSRIWSLGPEATMTISLPGMALTKKHIAKIKKYVAALEMEASVNWDDDETDGDAQ